MAVPGTPINLSIFPFDDAGTEIIKFYYGIAMTQGVIISTGADYENYYNTYGENGFQIPDNPNDTEWIRSNDGTTLTGTGIDHLDTVQAGLLGSQFTADETLYFGIRGTNSDGEGLAAVN